MHDNGADIRFIQQLLGHEKLETTAIYAEVSINQLKLVHAKTHPAHPAILQSSETNDQKSAKV